uniref:Serpin domain-containing protein n=1 Tax=Kalanchoe fedtschenkoi TaxID=63787 RepID=A0A7N0ZWH9_KALFE
MDVLEAISSQTDVALTLTNRLIATEASGENFVYSPVSIQVVLSLIAAGSKGRALDELLSFLKSKSTDDLGTYVSHVMDFLLADGAGNGGPKLAVANGVWVDESLKLKTKFEQVVSGVHKAAARQVDFQTKHVEVTREVNSWVDEKTRGLIKHILPAGSVNHMTRLILTNAIYFKGSWTRKFDASATRDHDFHLLTGGAVRAPFMTSREKQYVAEFDGFKVLELRYKQGGDNRQFSMYIFLPDAKDGLPALTEKLGSGSDFLDEHTPTSEVPLRQFLVPKFKISFGFEASEVLRGLGIVSPFTDLECLSEMVDESTTSGQELYVSSIFHKSFIEVNEEGTEAAAVTTLCGVGSAPGSRRMPTEFVADHPFLFVIRENMTRAVLFIGHVLNPLEN